MILVTGGIASGKRAFVRSLGYADSLMSRDAEGGLPVVLDAQELARGLEGAGLDSLADALACKEVAVCTEVGGGIVPLDPAERGFRESAGRLAVLLADRAECTVRMVCGIPQVLKGSLPTGCRAALRPAACAPAAAREPQERAPHGAVAPCFLSVYRHAPTRLNRAHRYQGQVDEPLDWEGEEVAYAMQPSRCVRTVYVSPLSRSRQTARILFPCAEQVVVPDLMEMDFGEFDGFTYQELSADPRYCAWLDSNCTSQCPGGESREGFSQRICRGIRTVLQDAAERCLPEAVVVAHGGTAMAAFWKLAESDRDYFDWQMQVCGGLRARVLELSPQRIRLEEAVPVLPSQSLG